MRCAEGMDGPAGGAAVNRTGSLGKAGMQPACGREATPPALSKLPSNGMHARSFKV